MSQRLTEEQQAVIDALATQDRITVQAFAGTGKTTTLEALARAYPERRMLYLAFNRSVARAARRRFPANVTVLTTHALAFQATKDRLPLEQVRPNYRAAELVALGQTDDTRLAWAALSILEAWCQSDIEELSTRTLPDILNTNPLLMRRLLATLGPPSRWCFAPEQLVELARRLFEQMCAGQLAPTHSTYLKYCQIHRQHLLPRYDVVLLDEAQDTNPVTLSLVETAAPRIVAVGDSHQQIYAFRGSLDALRLLQADCQLALTRSWRLSDDIAREANRLLERFKAETRPIVGGHNQRNGARSLAFLGRTNAGLILAARDMLQAGFTDFRFLRSVDEVFRLPLALLALRSAWKKRQTPRLPEELSWLAAFGSASELEAYIDETHDTELGTAWNLVTCHGPALPDLYRTLRTMPARSQALITLATVHTAKGLEWDRVVVLDDFGDLAEMLSANGLHRLAQLHRIALSNRPNPRFIELLEEINLLYVAFTRARIRLEPRTVNALYLKLSRRDFERLLDQQQEREPTP